MACTIEVTRRYPLDPETLWTLATDWRRLQDVSAPLLKFRDMPVGAFAEGQNARYSVSLFGQLAETEWTARILRLDPDARVYETREGGGAFRRWDHRMTIDADAAGSVMTDRVEIDAGSLNWLAAYWVRLVYVFRHTARRRLALA